MWFRTIKKSQEPLIIIPIWKNIWIQHKKENRKMFKKKLFTKSYKFCIKNCQKMAVFLPKCRLLRQGPMIFYLFLFSESPKNLLKNIRRRFFKYIIFNNLFDEFYLKKVIFWISYILVLIARKAIFKLKYYEYFSSNIPIK